VPDHHLNLGGYFGEAILRVLVSANLITKEREDRFALYGYKPTELGLKYYKAMLKEKKIYKCEIMHEVLDPLNTEVWECSNCGAIACMEHLEKWYHRKQAPECFKCGKTSTFKINKPFSLFWKH
jgi:hypothetical protein